VADLRASSERGFTLIELVITTAIIATIVAAGVAIALGSRSFAVSAAAAEFDHLLDSARTVARETEGATLVFAPDAFGDGTEIRVMAPGSDDSLTATALPVVHARAAIEEAALGKAPFAFVVHASGSLGGRPGYRLGDSTASGEVGCPAAGVFHFVIRAAGATAERVIPCRITLAATGPLAFATWPPASIAPLPTPCAGACQPGALPTPPASSPTCPPNFAAAAGGCTPITPNAPRYHVTASLASPTMTVGGTDSITAQATLSNPSAVPAGTPATIPVIVQVLTGPICSASPAGAQPSGSSFALSALSAGTCTVTINADVSAVLGATADTVTVSMSVSSAPGTTPSPASCDLVANGKCYHRIVDRTMQTFRKHVVPDDNCATVVDNTCTYVDSIKDIFLEPGFGFQAPVPPIDPSHELLVRIDSVVTVYKGCLPFTSFATLAGGSQILWGGNSVGAPANAPDGLGEPSIFTTSNHVITDFANNGVYTLDRTWGQPTTLSGLFVALAFRRVGVPFSFTYHAADAAAGSYLQLHPDFPGCDAAADVNFPGVEYGDAAVSLLLEIFQAVP
jgi:prepilin-type N-terminal cleavage/methylation domain-containing protein